MIPINTQLPIAVGFVDSRQGGRAENQDTCGYADTPLGLLVVVCDGHSFRNASRFGVEDWV